MSAAEVSALKLGTRGSPLAMWQANFVRDLCVKNNIPVDVLSVTTTGDIDLTSPLSKFSNKGVFTKELDIALFDGRIDFAVHCMKDLPTTLVDGLSICAVLDRGDTEDAVVIHSKHQGRKLADLPQGSIIGTSALRRVAVLSQRFPQLVCKDIRGNVNSRLAKLDNGDYDALILARTGLKRLGFDSRISEVLEGETYGYAIGQGALAIVCRTEDLKTAQALAFLNHLPTQLACEAERALLRTLEGGCKVPITVRTQFQPLESSSASKLFMVGSVLSVDGQQEVTHKLTVDLPLPWSLFAAAAAADAPADAANVQRALLSAREAGNSLAANLLSQGADVILRAIKSDSAPAHVAPSRAAAAAADSSLPSSSEDASSSQS